MSGETDGSLGGPNAGSSDVLLARYDSTGNQLWIQQFGTTSFDAANIAVPGGSGRVYVGGLSDSSLGGPSAGDYDAFVACYDGSAVTVYCLGDGSGATCPCGNSDTPGQGCANSSGTGAVVSSMGSTSVSLDDLVFRAANLLSAQPALLFAGVNTINGGNGNPFGDGLRCAGGNVVRLGVQVPSATGDATFGPGLVGLGGFAPGALRPFQVWYRDPVGEPCGSGFNLSHGVEVSFIP